MGFFDTVKENLTVTSQGVAQKFSNATESAKLSSQVKSNQRMIEKLLFQVGEKCFALHGLEEGTPYETLFVEIKRLQSQNIELQEQITELSMELTCSKCGFKNNGGTKFCISCGTPLGEEVKVPDIAEEHRGKICPSCQSVNAEDALFCTECGTKLEETV